MTCHICPCGWATSWAVLVLFKFQVGMQNVSLAKTIDIVVPLHSKWEINDLACSYLCNLWPWSFYLYIKKIQGAWTVMKSTMSNTWLEGIYHLWKAFAYPFDMRANIILLNFFAGSFSAALINHADVHKLEASGPCFSGSMHTMSVSFSVCA